VRRLNFYCTPREYRDLAYWAEAAGYATVEAWLEDTLWAARLNAEEGGVGDAPSVGASRRAAAAAG